MSTRSTTHFRQFGETDAIIYRHSDGYPSGAGSDLMRFLAECGALDDSRLGDASMLAARYVVFLARQFNRTYATDENGVFGWQPNDSPLDFLSVRVVSRDPGDIEYRYVVTCADDAHPLRPPEPTVEVFRVWTTHDGYDREKGFLNEQWHEESLGSVEEAMRLESQGG